MKNITGINNANYKHGKSKTRLYRIWTYIKNRCHNHNALRYCDYGGRDIRVCDEWLNDFRSFESWAMENGYNDNLSIDRIDNDGNYSPKNCRWATVTMQNRNQRIRKDNCSGARGVRFRKDMQKWQARIAVNGESVFLGSFSTKDDAVYARCQAEKKYWTNFEDNCDGWEERA